MLTRSEIEQIATDLVEAERTRQWTTPVSRRFPHATIEDAYRIGMAVRDIKVAGGTRVAGHKIGLVSKAMQARTGATEPDYGFLYEDWFIAEGSAVDKSKMNRPAAEAEIAFVMKEPLSGKHVNAADVIRATDFVLPMIEVVDSRYRERGDNLLVDSISDAATCGYCVLGGNPARLTDIDVRKMGASLSVNGEIQQSGTARAVLGNPINAVAWLARKLTEFDVSIQPGDIVLSGSFIQIVPFKAGDSVLALFDELGEVGFSVLP